MRSRFMMMLFLIVLGIGLIGVFVSIARTASNQTQPQAQVQQFNDPEPEPIYAVWVAKHDIVSGQIVSRRDFKLERIPESKAFEVGIQEDIKLDFVEGMVLSGSLSAADPVFPEQIVYPNSDRYLNLVLEPGYVPVTMKLAAESLKGKGIIEGELVDVMALTSSTQNLAHDSIIRDLGNVSFIPILTGVKVLQVLDLNNQENKAIEAVTDSPNADISVVLQLTRKQQAKLTIAKSVAKIEILLSVKDMALSELSADSADIMPDYKSVRELRGVAGDLTPNL